MKNYFMLEEYFPLESIRKLLRIMKLTLTLAIIGICQIYATDSYSQNARISLDMQNVKIEDVFTAIEKQSNYEFFYNNSQIDANQQVSVHVKEMKISEILSQLLANKELDYKVLGNRIVLVKSNSFESELLTTMGAVQQITVTGRVKDGTSGDPIPGVNILVEGTTIGVVSDADGKYSVDVPSGNATLLYSYIGYLTEKVLLNNRLVVDINLTQDIQNLEEVVVVGYGTVKKRDLTGSVASIKSDDITKTASSNAMQSLQARMPGIDVQQADGQSGSGLNITLRGKRSISASNDPLILVDGIEYGSTLDLNPSDIESMDVLKDASSTAIYGTRGANGVIIITTKRGKAGKTIVNFSAFTSSNRPANVPKVMYGEKEVQRYIDAANYKADYTSGNWGASNLTAADVLTKSLDDGTTELSIYEDGSYTNWADIILKNGLTHNYELSVSGGNEKTNYNLSLGSMDEQGLMKNDELKRYNGKISIDHKINNAFKVGSSLLYTYKDHDARNSSVFSQSMKMTTITHAYLNDGTINKQPNPHYSAHCNPLLDEVDGAYQNNVLTSRLFGNTYLEITPLKNLVLKSMFALDKSNNRKGLYEDYQSVARYQSPSTTYISSESENTTKYTWDNTLNYNFTLGKHNINALLGHSMTQSVYEESLISGTAGQEHYYKSSFYDLSKISTANTPTSVYRKTALLSYFGRLNYKFNEKYLLTASYRADGSSTLANGHKWGYFPSVAAAWRVSEESFLSGFSSWLSNLKLRTSWGISGNSAIQAYQTLATLSSTNVYYYLGSNTITGNIPSNMGNENLKWETTAAYNYGVDFGFFNNRISGSVDYFTSKTSDLLYYRTLPASSVYTSVLDNIGKSEAHGIEVALNTQIIKLNDFSWDVNWSYYHARDKVTFLADDIDKDISQDGGTSGYMLGQPVSMYFDYEPDGCWGVGEYSTYVADWQTRHSGETIGYATEYGTPGTVKIVDRNDDGKINEDDKRIYERSPKHIFGMNNTFSYKNLSLSVQVYARLGGYLAYGLNSLVTYDESNWGDLDYWTYTNQGAKFPTPAILTTVSNAYTPYAKSLRYEKADYIKIKDITLSYSLPKGLIGKIGLDQIRVYGSLKNYFTFSKIDNYDPERGGAISFPLAKQMVFGVNVQF
jgi:TonB-dependent starch-binding outer membrane protein SusC